MEKMSLNVVDYFYDLLSALTIDVYNEKNETNGKQQISKHFRE